MDKLKKLPFFLMMLLAISSCTPVHPWEKGILAKRTMSFSPDPLEDKFRQHIFESKEGSRGGAGVAAGGCGCN